MSAIERITKAAHLIDMNDIIREGKPQLYARLLRKLLSPCLTRKSFLAKR